MIVNGEDRKLYKVTWAHIPEGHPPGTLCTILETDLGTFESYGSEVWGLKGVVKQSRGSAELSEKDQYEYDKGRKVSLARALQGILPSRWKLDKGATTWHEIPVEVSSRNKRARRAFWLSYHHHIGPLARKRRGLAAVQQAVVARQEHQF